MKPESIFTYVIFTLFVAQTTILFGQKVLVNVESDTSFRHKSQFKTEDAAKKYMTEKISEFRKKGYAEANIDSIAGENRSLTYYVHIGPEYRWQALKFDSIPKEVTSSLNVKSRKIINQPFDSKFPHQLGEDILSFYENNGYPFARVKYDSVIFDSGKVAMKIVLDKGPLVRIDSIAIKGNLKINPHYIYRTTGIRPGDLYSEKKIRDIPATLRPVPFIKRGREHQLYFSKGSNILFIYLDSRKTNSFSGIIGFQNDPNTQKLMLTGDLSLALNNVFRQGEWIILNWNRFQNQSQKLDLDIGFPYLFKTPVGIEASIRLFKQDSTFLDVKFEGGLLFNIGAKSRLSFSIASRNSNILTTGGGNTANLADVKLINYAIRINHFGYDYIFNPRKGLGGSLKIIFAKKSLGNDVDENIEQPDPLQYQGILDSKYFIPLFKRQAIGFFLKGGMIINKVIFENEMFRLGGLKTIRGFNEASIYADKYAVGTLEYRFLYEKNANIRVFADGGYFENKNVPDASGFLLGLGLGASVETKAGIFKIDFAIGKFGAEPFAFNNTKVHFGYLNTF